MQRVVVIGISGSGKSVFSQRLGEKLHIPVIHLDAYFHTAGWKKVTKTDWDKQIESFIRQKTWILDGNYKRTLDVRIKAADIVIYLEIPKWLAFYRIIKRRMTNRSIKRPDLPVYLNEQISLTLIRKTLFYSKKEMFAIINKHKTSQHIIVLKGTKSINTFLNK